MKSEYAARPVDYDVVVVGAGPAGSTTAALMAEQGRRVLLVDQARFPRAKACAEYISPGGVEILRRLGVLAQLGSGRWLRGMELVAPSGARHLIGYGQGVWALSVSRLELDAALVEVARARGAEVREGLRVRRLVTTRGGPSGYCARTVTGVEATTGYIAGAGLVVGADGLQSVVGRELGVRRLRRWPRRLGLVAHVGNVDWDADTGQMWLGRDGSYVGATPLNSSRVVTVGLATPLPMGHLGDPAEALQRTLACNYPELHERLQGGDLTEAVRGVGRMAVRVTRVAGPGWALVGDAAGFFDPFTGEGIFRALRGAELLACNPARYARARRREFAPKERLVTLVQAVIERPRLLEFAIRRLNERPDVACELGQMLGDVRPARLGVAWRLLGP